MEINVDDAIEDQLEAIIQTCENTKNSFVDGVPRALMRLVCSTKTYGKIRNALDKTQRANVDTSVEEFLAWHGVDTRSSVHLPAGCEFLLMVVGAVAQPVYSVPYRAEKVPLSDAHAVSIFFHYGTKTVMPDLIFKPKFVKLNAKLSSLSIGSLTLTPTFNADTTSYTAATTNATNTVTATAADSGAAITITNGSATVANGSAATWTDGENTLKVTVTKGTATKTYTVTVTKS